MGIQPDDIRWQRAIFLVRYDVYMLYRILTNNHEDNNSYKLYIYICKHNNNNMFERIGRNIKIFPTTKIKENLSSSVIKQLQTDLIKVRRGSTRTISLDRWFLEIIGDLDAF